MEKLFHVVVLLGVVNFMMFCTECGSHFNDKERFCGNCGAKLNHLTQYDSLDSNEKDEKTIIEYYFQRLTFGKITNLFLQIPEIFNDYKYFFRL